MNQIPMPREIQELMASLMPREPNYRYFESRLDKKQRMFCWTTERVNGKFACWTYATYGKGSRSGNATRWKMRGKVLFNKRKDAKARAYKRYLKMMNEIDEMNKEK